MKTDPENQAFAEKHAGQIATKLAEEIAQEGSIFETSDYGFSEHRQAYTGLIHTDNGRIIEATMYLKITTQRSNRPDHRSKISLSRFFAEDDKRAAEKGNA